MLKELIGMAIPISGDIKIHNLFAKDRINAKKEIQDIKSRGNQLNEREEKFRHELYDLLKKHNIKEEMGSLVSYPSQYVANEKSDLGNIVVRSTIVPEVVVYCCKYIPLIMASYQQFSS